MPLFACSNAECRAIDNTAVSPRSWQHIYGDGLPLCTKCATGKAHDLFEPSTYDPAAPIGSGANPEHLWADGGWRNEPPRRVGSWHTVKGERVWLYDDGFPGERPYTWVDGVAIYDDLLGQAGDPT